VNIALFHNLPSGGAKRAVYEMARELSARGHSLHEFTFSTADLDYLPLAGIVAQSTVFPLGWLPLMRHRVPMLTPYLNTAIGLLNLRQLDLCSRVFAQTIDANGFDLVFVNDCRFLLNPNVLRYLRTRSIFYCHHGTWHSPNEDPEKGESFIERLKGIYYAPSQWLYRYVEEHAERRNIQAAKRILVNSEFAQERLFSVYRVQSEIVYLGVDTEKFKPINVRHGKYIFAVGAVTYRKGYRFLIEALSRIPTPVRPCLVIAANSEDPSESKYIQKLAQTCKVALRIEKVTNDDYLIRLYSGALAFVCTAINEPFGLAVLEAMACGAPVVAIKEGGVRESVVDGITGFLVERDMESFASVLAQVLDDDSLRKRLGTAGIEWVNRHWTWRHCVDRLEEQFSACIGAVTK